MFLKRAQAQFKIPKIALARMRSELRRRKMGTFLTLPISPSTICPQQKPDISALQFSNKVTSLLCYGGHHHPSQENNYFLFYFLCPSFKPV